jgi:hypothetical protein
LKTRPALCAMALALAGCMTWRTQPRTAQQLIAERHPQQVRVTLSDGTRVTLYGRPEVSGDSLAGLRMVRGWDTPATVPLAEIREVAVRRLAPVRTAILAASLGAIVVGFASAHSCDPPSCRYLF